VHTLVSTVVIKWGNLYKFVFIITIYNPSFDPLLSVEVLEENLKNLGSLNMKSINWETP
jgi:hypothetical protein